MGGVFYDRTGKNQKYDLVVIRVNSEGNICNGRPCFNCLNMMRAVGIRKVYYSGIDGDLVVENVKDMISIEASKVTYNIENMNASQKATPNEYYESKLKKLFPSSVKHYNLEHFIKHNLNNVLPNCQVNFSKKDGLTTVIIMKNDRVIVSSQVY